MIETTGQLAARRRTIAEIFAPPRDPRRFRLRRLEDVTGVSGTGVVAEGVEFGDGVVAVRWFGEHATTTVHEDMGSVEHIHCHAGRTVIDWLDEEVMK